MSIEIVIAVKAIIHLFKLFQEEFKKFFDLAKINKASNYEGGLDFKKMGDDFERLFSEGDGASLELCKLASDSHHSIIFNAVGNMLSHNSDAPINSILVDCLM